MTGEQQALMLKNRRFITYVGEEEEAIMAEICSTCGLPKSICVCSTISREQQRVKIKIERRKWNKPTTVIEGLDGTKKDLQEIAPMRITQSHVFVDKGPFPHLSGSVNTCIP